MASIRSSKAVHSEVDRDASASQQYQNVRCSELRVKGFVLVGGRPCKIVEMSSSKTGKHGSCKVHLVAVDAFTGKKRVTAHTSTDVVQTPVVVKRECRLLQIVVNDAATTAAATVEAPPLLQVEEKSGALASVRLCQDKSAAGLLEAARQLLLNAADDADGDVIVTVMSAMGEEAAVAVRRRARGDR